MTVRTHTKPNAVDKALALLALFGGEYPYVRGLSDLAAASGQDKATCYRGLTALVRHGLLQRDGDKYRLGFRILELADRLRRGLAPILVARPYLERLSQATRQSAQLVLRQDDEAVYADVVEGQEAVRLYIRPGRRAPLYAGASTRLHLAFLDENQRAAYYARTEFRPMTRNTVTDPVTLESMHAHTRRTWFAISFGELEPFSAELAAPVFDSEGRLAACISVAGPEQVFMDGPTLGAFVKTLDEVARDLSQRMGFSGRWASDCAAFIDSVKASGRLGSGGMGA